MPNISAKTITVPSILNDYTDEQLNREYHSKEEYARAIEKYGAIYRTVNFSDVKDPELLQRYAKEWIRRNYYDGVLSFTIKAVDLHLLGYEVDKLQCGDQIPVEFIDDGKNKTTKTLTCLSVQYDLLKPENTSYKIGIPDISTNVKYRESVSVNGRNSGGGKSQTDGAFIEKVWKTSQEWQKTTYESMLTWIKDLGVPVARGIDPDEDPQ